MQLSASRSGLTESRRPKRRGSSGCVLFSKSGIVRRIAWLGNGEVVASQVWERGDHICVWDEMDLVDVAVCNVLGRGDSVM